MTMQLSLLCEERDVRQVVALEAASYPEVEAANEKTIRLRQQETGQFFYVAHNADSNLVGFINGSLSSAKESTEIHDPNGSTLYIRSVVVDPMFRRQRIALRMLKQYVETVCCQQPQVSRIVLVAKMHLIELFIKTGFAVTRLAPTGLQLELDCNAARQIPIIQVDAFTREPFQGNPAAVVLLQPAGFHRKRASEWMQLVAREKNLGATAFAAPRETSTDVNVVEYDIKWFSPVVELTLCGHGTLSTAVALLDRGLVRPTQTVRFYNLTNILVCQYEATNDQQFRVIMDFPAKPPAPLSPSTSIKAIAAALGVSRSGVLDAQLALNDVIVRLDKSAFESLKPDYRRISEIETGFVVTTEAPSNHAADFLSRFFAPSIGINEDPVTGSAHCGLGPYWSAILDKRELIGYQSTSVRGGFVEIDLKEAQQVGRVLLKCQGVVVAYGMLTPTH